ncbi:MAG: hypothetical protein K6G28_00715, partial [Acholeplasmatales bacterium]|nr:hypothetical protein [Acholeplasmatales bacterium]
LNEQRTYCACCKNKTVFKRIDFDICPVCYWEKDPNEEIIYNPNVVSENNQISLIEGIRNYETFGACKEEFVSLVRKPFSYEVPNYKENNE